MASLWTEIYRKHFQKHFHKPFDIQVYHDRDGFALKLATHDLALKGYRIFASMGLADKLIENEEEDFGEVILYADVPDKEVPHLFVNALFSILHHDIPLGSRFTIGIDEMRPEFAERYGKSALYFTRPFKAHGEPDELRRGDKAGRVFQAFFITPAEDEFLEDRGADAFEREFWEQCNTDLAEGELTVSLVDKSLKDFEARLKEVERQAKKVLSVRRESCV